MMFASLLHVALVVGVEQRCGEPCKVIRDCHKSCPCTLVDDDFICFTPPPVEPPRSPPAEPLEPPSILPPAGPPANMTPHYIPEETPVAPEQTPREAPVEAPISETPVWSPEAPANMTPHESYSPVANDTPVGSPVETPAKAPVSSGVSLSDDEFRGALIAFWLPLIATYVLSIYAPSKLLQVFLYE
eukprot:TRINITY_DN16305_c0_g1_i1.p1 TRINITY_DN16305_c0_g1~~TRINITY_DN16305_c0_g1_i1.p1  ORF type:complete len:187 (+),score=19.86 TRINITY_DN16305_c0_g1_i1:131-691(+)